MEERELLRRLRRGDPSALEELMDRDMGFACGLLAMMLVPSDTPPYTPSTFYLLFSLIALAGVIAAYVSQFWLYTGLDDVCTERGYDFPPKRIRWCFYLSLINILLRMLPTSIPIFLSQIASLVLLALFIRAAYQAEKLTV